MPLWLSIALAGIGLFQSNQAANAQREAMSAFQQGGLSDAEAADLQKQQEGALSTDLSRRGMLDSGLLATGRAKIAKSIGLAKAQGRSALVGSYGQALLAKSQQPTLFSLLPQLAMQYGLRGQGDSWLIPPYQYQPNQPLRSAASLGSPY